MVQCHVGAFDISKAANLPNKRQLAKKTLVEQNSQKKDLFDIMNNNYGKGNMVDGILKLLLSNENLASLDKTLVTLFTEMSEFDMLVEKLEHREQNPGMYSGEKIAEENSTESMSQIQKAALKLKDIRKLVKKSQHEMEKEKINLLKVHEIYTQKFQKRISTTQTNLDEKSKRILMESLMNSHNRSLINVQKRARAVEQDKSADESEIREVKGPQLEKSLSAVSRKTEEIKQIIHRQTPEKREAIIKSLETRKKVLKM